MDFAGGPGWAAVVCAAAVVLSGPSVLAQTLPVSSPLAPPLTSNRPGIAESEAILVPRAFQLESGFTLAEFSDGGVRHRLVDLPEATLRFGLTPRFELFANLSSYFWDRATFGGRAERASGASDLSVNAKIGWLSEARHGITLAAAVGLSLPVGSDEFSSGGYDPSVRLLWSRSVPGDFGLSGNLDIASVTAGPERLTAGAASLGLGRGLSESSSWFVELFGDFVEGGSHQWQLDGGIAVVPRPDVQIDLSAGRTLQSGPSAWFLAAGITLRHRR
ncbi:MAG: transporter [Vicinamibacterales bacterium]